MLKVGLRGVFARKLRAFLTALAVFLGVALMTGTYVPVISATPRKTARAVRNARSLRAKTPRSPTFSIRRRAS